MQLHEAISTFLRSMEGEASPRTIEWYKEKLRALESFLGPCEIDAIQAEDLRVWRSALLYRAEKWANHPYKPTVEAPLSPHTINGHIRAVRRFFRWLEEEGYIQNNPARKLRNIRTPDTEPKAASEKDSKRLLKAADESGERDYAIVCFLIDTGARANGVVTLTLDRLDLNRRRALVIEKSQKQERARFVYFTEETANALKAWLAVRPQAETNHVFLNVHGKPLTLWGLYQLLKRLAQKGGVEGRFNPHSFRHAFARRVLQQGADLATVSQLMGHSSVEVTVRYYARWADDELSKLHDRYSPLKGLLDLEDSE